MISPLCLFYLLCLSRYLHPCPLLRISSFYSYGRCPISCSWFVGSFFPFECSILNDFSIWLVLGNSGPSWFHVSPYFSLFSFLFPPLAVPYNLIFCFSSLQSPFIPAVFGMSFVLLTVPFVPPRQIAISLLCLGLLTSSPLFLWPKVRYSRHLLPFKHNSQP